jgi:phosphoglycolate phosphatase-like HAD superfamily hydrolase
MAQTEVFIDFDGVLCDSLLECLASSWYAYFILHKGEQPVTMRLETKRRFSALRPYIRSGGDYLLIQELMDNNIDVLSQADFDACLDGAISSGRAETYSRLFDAARRFLLETYAASWVRLNPLYAHVRPRLQSWCASPRFFILSTKQPSYIVKILEANNIRMDGDRILQSPARGKLEMIRLRLQSGRPRRAVLVDDQLDHLLGNHEPRITPYLASWGYVRPQWLEQPRGVEILSPGDFTCLLDHSLALPPHRD